MVLQYLLSEILVRLFEDQDLSPFADDVPFLLQATDHPGGGLPRRPRHPRQVLVGWTAFEEDSLIGLDPLVHHQPQDRLRDPVRHVAERQIADLEIRIPQPGGQLGEHRRGDVGMFVEQADKPAKPEALEYFTSIFGEALKVRAMVCLHSENKKTIDNQWFFCKLVELGGIEPPTPCMPCRCSPS